MRRTREPPPQDDRHRSTARRRPGNRPAAWIRLARLIFFPVGVTLLCLGILLYRTLSRQIDERLARGWTRPPVTLFAAGHELVPGLGLDRDELVAWLDDLGYTRRDRARSTGEFSIEPDAVTLIELHGTQRGRTVRVRLGPTDDDATRVAAIEIPPTGRVDRLALGTPLLSTLNASARRKGRNTPLTEIPGQVIDAILAAEDHRFFRHPGIDAVRIASAAVTNLTGHRNYLVGASTLTQQLVKNTLLSPEQTVWRKLREQALAMLLERRLPKAGILELYLNEVYLGHQGSYAIHGVAQGARALFGKDLRNLTLGEAATMAGLIQAPQTHAPQRHPERARDRRNGVLQAMVDHGLVTPDRALVAAREPIQVIGDAVDREAPYFVDLVGRQLEPTLADGEISLGSLRIETTLDMHLQRLAEAAVRDGLSRIAPKRAGQVETTPQAALVAIEPRSGAIRALVGGRSYRESQFNRAERAHRQPGSVVKPFVYLAAFERARRDPHVKFTPASLIDDTPTTFFFDRRPWRPANHGQVYDGQITARMALARSRNVAAVTVAEQTGFQSVADIWATASGSATPPAYPAIALGVFESTPLQVAAAYSVLANGGVRAPLHTVSRIQAGARALVPPTEAARRVATAESAFLVTWMLRSTLDTGTAASVRRAGFLHEAAGKTGTTDDLRDAWFAGFTPTLLTVVWVGMDDGTPLGLTGAEAALPIWTDFMRRGLDGRDAPGFSAPSEITFVDIDRHSGLRATARCPDTIREAFVSGTEPSTRCPLH